MIFDFFSYRDDDSIELSEGENYLFTVKMFHSVRGVFNIEGSVISQMQ